MIWCNHVEAIYSKINQRIAMLKQIRHLLPVKKVFHVVQNSLISTLFDYADNIWGDKFNATLMDDLHVLQNKTKIILNLPFFSSSTQAVEALGWQTITKRRLLHRYVLIYEHFNGLINFDLNLLRNFNIHSYNTRKMNNLRFPRVQTNYGE